MNPTRVLLIDDDREDYLITRDLICEIKGDRKYDLEWTPFYEDARNIIAAKKHDVYLVDYHLGARTGLDLISEVYDSDSNVPFILLTGLSDSKIDELALDAGATDFLVKNSLTPGILERTIRYGIQHIRNLHEIRKLNACLEKRVQERTSELEKTVKMLEQTNDVLKEAIHKREKAEKRTLEALESEKLHNELKSRFITLASHEFRTPLSTILSSIHLLSHYKNEADQAKRDKHEGRIKSSAIHLTDLLNDFLSLEKLEAGKIFVSAEDFNFKSLVDDTIQEMQDIAKQGQLIKHIHEDKSGPLNVLTDKRHTKGILINLLSNAIKYSGENAIISVHTFNYPEKQLIEVCDHGIGIPREDQQHLFERFFRAQNAVNIQGTGLGLSIVKKYLDMLGGTISFRSTRSPGRSFIVLFSRIR